MTHRRTGSSPVGNLAINAGGQHTAVATPAAQTRGPAAANSTAGRQRASVFGPGAVLTARLPLSDTGANTADPHLCDAYTGPIMAIADATPVICSVGVASPSWSSESPTRSGILSRRRAGPEPRSLLPNSARRVLESSRPAEL